MEELGSECVLAQGHVGELQALLYWFTACVFDSRITSLRYNPQAKALTSLSLPPPHNAL